MLRARLAYLRVLSVSSRLPSALLTHAIMSVVELPPRESCSILVSLLSRYGTWLPRLRSSPRAEMTFPRARRPLLMFTLSLKRCPIAPVFLLRSEPARSTRWNFAMTYSCCPLEGCRSRCSTRIVKIACERELWLFISVPPVARHTLPRSSSRSISSTSRTISALAPATKISPAAPSRIAMALEGISGCSRSLTSSLYISRNWQHTRHWALSRRSSTPSKSWRITRGMMPTSCSRAWVLFPEPMVYVLPDPVCPYASTVALYPLKHDSTSEAVASVWMLS
mmetsp:Transcript_66742/g.211235  ORF Transcript_66742/g.211235 Transcript_66742/m.211235 type:complete len:280 (+) Transcript_66742:1076-1915(+)